MTAGPDRPEPGLTEACEELRRQVEGLDGLLGDGSDMFEDTRGGDDRLNGGEGNDSLDYSRRHG
jgi:hypothetical protein